MSCINDENSVFNELVGYDDNHVQMDVNIQIFDVSNVVDCQLFTKTKFISFIKFFTY